MTTNIELVELWGQRGVFVTGTRIDVSDSIEEDITDLSASDYPFPSSVQATTIESNNVADDSSGTGARTIVVKYLLGPEDGFKMICETLTMDGTTPVPFTRNAYRFLSAIVATVGSNEANVGLLEIKQGGTVIGNVLPVSGRSRMGIYTVPGGITRVQVTSIQAWNSNKSAEEATITLRIRPNQASWQSVIPILTSREPATIEINTPIFLQPGTDIALRTSFVSTSGLNVTCVFSLDFLT